MTDDLVQLWRDGDPMAATAVRNALRGIADAVLTSPTGQAGGAVALADADRRRDATAVIAKEVMQRGGTSADELRGLTVMVSARHAVVEARSSDGGSGVDSHLPPQLVVSVALAPDSLSSHARGVADRHLGECASCTHEVDLVRRVVKGVTLPRPVAPASSATVAPAPTSAASTSAATTSAAPATEAPPARREVHPAPVSPAAAASVSPAAGGGTQSRSPRKPAATGGPIRPPRGGRLDRSPTVGWFQAMWPLLAIIAVLGVMLTLRARRQQASESLPAVALLADRSPPAVPEAAAVPDDASSALLDLERGKCDLAAARLRTSRMRNPAEVALPLLEAATWVCAGDGVRAQEAADAYVAVGGEATPELMWIQAQAALLRGEASQARDRLVRLRPLVDLDRGARIDQQLAGLRTL